MEIRNVIRFKEDIFFEGAVQVDWFYHKDRANLVASNFVFHGKDYFGQSQTTIKEQNIIDTISFTQYFINKVYDDNEGINPFTLAIAGYGSGKSHLAVTLAQLLAKLDEECVNQVVSNIQKIDNKAAKEIQSSLKQKNLVLTINGMNDFNLNYEILKSAKKSLDLYGLDDDILLSISSACDTAKRFAERYFHKNEESFENAASKHGVRKRGVDLYEYIINQLGYDDIIYDIVNEVYSDLTGHEIRWDQGISAGKILETLSNEYCASRGLFNKIVIIFDEFGRYLEYASAYSAKAGDSALQQIFEATQNTNGQIQFLGFIQSDIKTYLTRVDQSSNISRYISRYDHSDKLHLSSNLETIFANIIERPDMDLFDKYVSSRVLAQSNTLYQNIVRWIPQIQARGAWSNVETFNKVICEGIYPFHPLTTYLLSSMSDWLQNRSSLVLLNTNIKRYGDYDIEDSLPLISPTDILDNELFLEILNAEDEGRQRSRFATVYDNIIKRYGTRLSENEIQILKANLIVKICRFNASSREDAIRIIETCTHLTIEDINNALNYLEVEYGVLSYDERANSFEFVEDSLGASDFRAFMKRKRNNTSCNYDLLADNNLLDLFGMTNPINTDFGLKRFITTNEWQFEQKLYLINDFTSSILNKIKQDCITRYSVDKPKGILIWLYVNKEFSYDEVERVQAIIKELISDDIPIRIFLLDDSANNIYDYLIDYTVVSEITTEEAVKYGAYLEDYKNKLNRNLGDCINDLKAQRKLVTSEGISSEGIPRLPIYLSKVFSELYPNVIPFTFDGFNGKAGTITKTRKLLCSIEKFLCSDLSDYLSIKTQTVDVQRRFEAILSGNGPMSWKTITYKGIIVAPGNIHVETLYKKFLDDMDNKGRLEFKVLINTLRTPPYGINDMAISLFLVVFISIHRDRIKLIYDEQRYSVAKWSEKVISENNIDFDVIGNTTILVVDSLDVRKRFKDIFERISANTDIEKVSLLEKELNQYLLEEDLPKDMEDSLTLAKSIKLEMGRRHAEAFKDMLGEFKEAINRYHENSDLSNVIEMAEKYQYPSVILSNGYELTERHISMIKKRQKHLENLIEGYFDLWSDEKLRCREVGAIGAFIKHCKKISLLLENLGMKEFARKTKDIMEREANNIEAIKERQMVSSNIKEFISRSKPSKDTAVVVLNEWLEKDTKLRKILEENTIINKYDRSELIEQLDKRKKEISSAINEIKNEIGSIWDMFYEIESNDDLLKIKNKINILLSRQLDESDTEDLLTLQLFINSYMELDNQYSQYTDNRSEINHIYRDLIEKYDPDKVDFDISLAIKNRYNTICEELDKKECKWIEKFIDIDLVEEVQLQQWILDTKNLPLYLSENCIRRYNEKKVMVDKELKKYKVNYIISLISELSDAEWFEIVSKVNR